MNRLVYIIIQCDCKYLLGFFLRDTIFLSTAGISRQTFLWLYCTRKTKTQKYVQYIHREVHPSQRTEKSGQFDISKRVHS